MHDVVQKFEITLAHQKELEKKLKGYEAKASAGLADELAATAVTKDGLKWVSAIVTTDSPETLRSLGSQVLHKVGNGVVQLGAIFDGKVSLVAYCSPEAIKAGHQAGKLISGSPRSSVARAVASRTSPWAAAAMRPSYPRRSKSKLGTWI